MMLCFRGTLPACVEQCSWLFLSSPQVGIEVLVAVLHSGAIVLQYPGAVWGMVPDFCTSGATLLECLMYEIQYCRWERISGSYLIQSLAEGSTTVKVAPGSTWLCVVEFWEKFMCMETGHLSCPGYLMKVHQFQLQTLPMTVDAAGTHRHGGCSFSCPTDCAVGVVW